MTTAKIFAVASLEYRLGWPAPATSNQGSIKAQFLISVRRIDDLHDVHRFSKARSLQLSWKAVIIATMNGQLILQNLILII